MKASRHLLLAVFLLCSILHTRAQPLFLITDHQAELPATFSLDVKAATIDNLAGVQFSVRWDAGLLNLVEINDLGLDIDLEDNFGTDEVPAGRLNFFWLDGTTNGIAIPDTITLFSLTFQVVADPNFSTPVEFSDLPGSPIEVINGSLEIIDAGFQDGTVQIGQITSTTFLQADRRDGSFSPNPIRQYGIWELPATRETEGTLQAYDSGGKLLFSRNVQWPSDNAQIPIQAAQFPGPGMYYLEVRLNTGRRFTQPVIVQ